MGRLIFDSDSSQRAEELFELVKWQIGFGARYPGTTEHKLFQEALAAMMRDKAGVCCKQEFQIELLGKPTICANLVCHLKTAARPEKGPLLIGTHYDTRLQADNERDPVLRAKPILGANDGGSGTAILLHMIDLIRQQDYTRDIFVVLFDAEDVGNIGDNSFSMGAEFLAQNPLPAPPEEVLILDMVGGKDMILDIDTHIFHHEESRRLTQEIFALAKSQMLQPFLAHKQGKSKYIICDHYPFLMKAIPSCVLIDIDYPEWHTHKDLPGAMSPGSLLLIEDFVLAYLSSFLRE